jgi:hypothetical protein
MRQPCWGSGDKAIAYIKQAYDSGSTQDDKTTKAQEAFIKIRDFESPYRIEAFLDYDLNHEQVKNAKCFYWGIGDKTIAYIKQAYDSGATPDDKIAKAKKAFDQINDKTIDASLDNMVCTANKTETKAPGTLAEIINLVDHISKLDDEYTDHNFVQLITFLDSYMSIDRNIVDIFISKHIDPYHGQAFIDHLTDYHNQHASFKMGELLTDLIEHGIA